MLSRANSALDLLKAVFALFVMLLDNLFFNLHAEENYVSVHILPCSSVRGGVGVTVSIYIIHMFATKHKAQFLHRLPRWCL